MVDREHLEYEFHVAEETTSKKRSQSKRLRKLSHFEKYLMTLLFIRVDYDYHNYIKGRFPVRGCKCNGYLLLFKGSNLYIICI